jgi:hypothetical protein
MRIESCLFISEFLRQTVTHHYSVHAVDEGAAAMIQAGKPGSSRAAPNAASIR